MAVQCVLVPKTVQTGTGNVFIPPFRDVFMLTHNAEINNLKYVCVCVCVFVINRYSII